MLDTPEEHHDRRVPELNDVVSPPRRFPSERMFSDSVRNRLNELGTRTGHFFTPPEQSVATTEITNALTSIRVLRMQLAAHTGFAAYARCRPPITPTPPPLLLPRASLATMVPARMMEAVHRELAVPNTVVELGTKRARTNDEGEPTTQPSPKRQRCVEAPLVPDEPSVVFPTVIVISSETESENSDDEDWRASMDDLLVDDSLGEDRAAARLPPPSSEDTVLRLSQAVLREAAQHKDRNYFETRMLIEQAEEEMRRRRRLRRDAARSRR